jgi:hypothetical protein
MLIQLKKLLHCTPPEVILDIFKWYNDDNERDLTGLFLNFAVVVSTG